MKMEMVKQYVERLADEFHPERVYLFGSQADGTAGVDSDVDLLVVMDGKKRGMAQALEIRKRIPRTFALDLLVKTPIEMKRGEKHRDGFICSILEQGKVLYEKHG